MRVITIIYRNMNDFEFGSLRVRKGQAWLEIVGRLKGSGTETRHLRIEYRHGKGKETLQLDSTEEE